MAKIIYLCERNSEIFQDFPARIKLLNRRLSPDNILPNPPIVIRDGGIKIGILNPTTKLLVKNISICLGFPVFIPSDWWNPGGNHPDGSYALFRGDDRYVELGTDVVASRTIWYLQTEHFFIASSSQRAIVAFAGNFHVNQTAFPHVLASGVLGPKNSWDERICYVESDEHLVLDRQTWQITHHQAPFEMHPLQQNREDFKKQLSKALDEVFSDIEFDTEKWALTLSGGLDSRAILAMLKQENIQCITWGPKAALSHPNSDPYVARKIAAAMNVRFKFFDTEAPVSESGRSILHRFIEAGEGRIDQFSAYRDGFMIWKQLFEQGFVGIIRGDEFLGLKRPVTTKKKVFTDMNYHLLDDFANLPTCRELGLKNQILPKEYEQRPGESITAWAYRIRFNIKKVDEMAALNEIKTCFMEVMNPLLSRKVVNIIKSIPYQMNANKSVFREIVEKITPPIEYGASHEKLEDILRQPLFREALLEELQSPEARRWLPDKLIDIILTNLSKPESSSRKSVLEPFLTWLKQLFPWVTVLTKFFPRRIFLDDYLLAFRAYIILVSCQLFSEDARLFEQLIIDEISRIPF